MAVGFAVALVSTLGPQVALACDNAVELTRPSVQVVAKAESALEQGRNRRAYYLLENAMSFSQNLARRIALVRVVADMRLNRGSLRVGRDSLVVLRGLLKDDPENPLLRARVAEALSYKPGSDAAALAILAQLETGDLMPDAESWATLALLRHRAGDALGRERALARCKSAAKYAAACPDPAQTKERAAVRPRS